MLKAIVQTKKPAFWVIIHILLGIACAFVSEIFILWFVAVVLSSFNYISRGSKDAKVVHLLYFITYLASLELLSRMTRSHRFGVPWEFGKYVVFIGAIYAFLVLNARKGLRGYFLFLLLIPAMFFGGQREILWHDIVFNLLGPISVAFAIIAFYNARVLKGQFRQLLKLMLYPAISILAYVVIRTPDLKSLEFELGANFATTGGYGSNQVSTILGLGLFITFLFWVNRWSLTGFRLADLALMLGFAFQGLISFSRGGIVGGLLGIIIYIFMIGKAPAKMKRIFTLPKIGKYVLPALIGLFAVFQVADAVTGGLLKLRYSGETNATLKGVREVDINTLTTGRFDIFMEDVGVWLDHFVMGSGAGVSQHLRMQIEGGTIPIASHVELSRLLADHGLLGLTWFVILLVTGFSLLKFNVNPKYQGILVALFAIGVYTTFHAATRTYITPLLIGISLIKIIDINEPDDDIDNQGRKSRNFEITPV